MEPTAKRPKVDEEDDDTCCANDAVSLQWVDIDAVTQELIVGEVVHPAFVHAFFGPEERIRGYCGLEVTISIDCISFYPLMEIKYASKTEDADDITQKLQDKFEYTFADSRGAFLQQLMQFRAEGISVEAFGEVALPSVAFLDGNLIVTQVQLANAHEKLKVC